MKPSEHADYWDRQAATYDERTAWIERKFLAASRRWVCDRAVGRTLEVAIGTGANLPHYRSAGDTGAAAGTRGEGAGNTSDPATTEQPLTLTGLDQSPEMMRRARARASELGIDLDLHTGDATALPFVDDSFDTYVCTYAMCSIPDVRLALTEALRVLRPGGRLLLADHVAATNWILRGAQHLLNLFSVPLQGESWTRRPMNQLTELSATISETDRLHHGAIERIHATTGC